MLRFSALVACILLYASSFVNATSATRALVNSTIVCNDPYNDCSYQGDGVGVEYICTNGGNCFCNNAEICNCEGNAGDCNCGYATTCYCAGNDGDCCYTAAGYPVVDNNYGDNWETSDGVCYGDSSDSDGPQQVTLIVVGVCLGVLLILLVVAAIIRRRRYYSSLETNVVYAPVPSYGIAPAPVSYNPYIVPQSGYTSNVNTYNTSPPPPGQQYNYYPTPNNYNYTATSNDRR